MGWREEGECLVLPGGTAVTMRHVREIDDARAALKKWEEEEFKKKIAARNRQGRGEGDELTSIPHSFFLLSRKTFTRGQPDLTLFFRRCQR